MRTKSRGGGKRRLKTAASPKPFKTTTYRAYSLLHQDSMQPEVSMKQTNDGVEDMDRLQKDFCIRCNEGGKLLVCIEIGCPIAVHEKCMSCKPMFDDEGNFYCPYCSYKRELIRTRELRKKAMAAKKALSKFIDAGVVGGNNSEQRDGITERRETNVSLGEGDANPSYHGEGTTCLDQSRMADNNETQPNPSAANVNDGNFCQLEETTPAFDSPKDPMTKDNSFEAKTYETVIDRTRVQDEDLHAEDQGQAETSNACQTEEETVVNGCLRSTKRAHKSVKISDKTQYGKDDKEHMKDDELEMPVNTSIRSEANDPDAEALLKKKKKRIKVRAHKAAKQKDIGLARRSPRQHNEVPEDNAADQIEKVSASRKWKQRLESAKQFEKMTIPNAKRRRFYWTSEEEDMLKEGVQKFSTTTNKNLPWRKILEFGRHIFHTTRSPAELKDKWRNIIVRESSSNK